MINPNPLFRRSNIEANAEIEANTDNPYERFGLSDNPFPIAPTIQPMNSDPRENGSIYETALRRDEQEAFDKKLIPHRDRPSVHSMTMLMDYATRRGRGIGKTAFITHQRSRIMKDFGNEITGGAFVLLAAHVIPGGSGRTRYFWQFARLLAETLNQDDCIASAVWRLRAFSEIIPDTVLDQIDISNPGLTLGNDRWLEEKGINVMFDLNPAVEHKLIQAGVSSETAHSLAWDGADCEKWTLHFLDRNNDYWWRQRGDKLVFNELVLLFKAAEIDHVMLLVDEVENIVIPQSRLERRAFVVDLRRYFVDGNFQSASLHFYSLLLTIHPQIQEIWNSYWGAAGLDRVCAISGGTAQEYTILFHPLKPEDAAVPLALAYLNHYRLPGMSNDLNPFTKDAVVEALRLSGGVPGIMLNRLRLILEKAREQGWEIIDAEQIKQLREAVLPSEPPELDESQILQDATTDLMGDG